MTDYPLTRSLAFGERMSQDEVEGVFDTNFGYQIRGINYRTTDEGPYVILLSNEGEVYDDEIGPNDTFYYIGEGLPDKGDQEKTTANRALIEAAETLIPIYLFVSEEGVDEYEYQGLVEVENHRYVNNGERMVFRFEMQKLGISSWEDYVEAKRTVEHSSGEEPSLTEDPTSYTVSQRKTRSSAFSRKVKEQYDYTCAVCGARWFSPDGNPEVEAAHIYPKSENGADNVQNGLALCRFHHWALDSGWIAVSDEFEILVSERTDREPPEAIASLQGGRLNGPGEQSQFPHPKYLKAHRKLHGFEQQ